MGGRKKMSREPVKELVKVPEGTKEKLKFYKKEKVDIEAKIAIIEKEYVAEEVEDKEESEVKKVDDAAKKEIAKKNRR